MVANVVQIVAYVLLYGLVGMVLSCAIMLAPCCLCALMVLVSIWLRLLGWARNHVLLYVLLVVRFWPLLVLVGCAALVAF
ncbi:hypothetical protein U1Q18_002831 [Sarracenia purpurea var. burkii]